MKKKRKITPKIKKENIWNVPNPITLSRIILSPILVLMVFHGMPLWTMIAIFALAASTDFFDGYLARKLNQVTNFGRKLDMIADRILMVSLVLGIYIYAETHGMIDLNKLWLIAMILSREILSAPFFIIAMFASKRPMPHARLVGKTMTLCQGITFPVIILGWIIAPALAIITSIIGIFSAGYYVYDSLINPDNKFQKEKDREYKSL